MQRAWKLFLLAMLALALSLPALAQQSSGRDAVQFGQKIIVHADDRARDLVCFLCSAQIDGSARDIVVFFGDLNVTGEVNDVVVFGGDAIVAPNGSLHDLVVMGGRLRADPNAVLRGNHVVFPPIILLVPLLVFAGISFLIVMLIRRLFLTKPQRVIYTAPPRRDESSTR